ncbi:MAG TPA: hypothetical protein GX711_06940 [Clostridia bacterium]|nr:hypothetical protein [Clostridia bacterium]
MLPVKDDQHQRVFHYAQFVAGICLSEKFIALKKELEAYYRGSQTEDWFLLAFQDALYAMMAEEEQEFFPTQAYQDR